MNHSNADRECSFEILLPWYANGSLRRREHRRMAGHLAECPLCLRQLAAIRQLRAVYKDQALPGWQPHAAGFARLEKKLAAESTAAERRPAKWREWRRAACLNLTGRPALLPGLLAAQALIIVFLTGVISMQTIPQSSYQTLSSESPGAAPAWPELAVIFSDRATERDIRNLLQACRGQIIGGPSVLGIYRIQLNGASAPNINAIITLFRHHPQVKFVTGEGAPS